MVRSSKCQGGQTGGFGGQQPDLHRTAFGKSPWPSRTLLRSGSLLARSCGHMSARESLRLSRNCLVDFKEQTVSRGFVKYRLSDVEARILEFFAESLGSPVSAEAAMERIWPGNSAGTRDNFNVQIRRIRSRIEDHPGRPRHLLCVRGMGSCAFGVQIREHAHVATRST